MSHEYRRSLPAALRGIRMVRLPGVAISGSAAILATRPANEKCRRIEWSAARVTSRWGRLSTNIERQGATMKLFCIIASAMTLVFGSSAAMAAHKKQSLSDKATHRMKSPRSVPAPLRQWPPNNPTYEEYLELKRQGWYKADTS